MISVTGALQAKIDLHKAGKLARRLNTEMKRYQAAVDAGADYGILLDAATEPEQYLGRGGIRLLLHGFEADYDRWRCTAA